MAIWQFQLVVIPEKGILERLGQIPNTLEVNYEERKEHFHLKKEGLIEPEDKFVDALVQDWWKTSKVHPMEIIHQMDKMVSRGNYGSDTFINWKFNNGKVDNDASMSINKESGNIEELRFRADLREEKLKFLIEMIALANKYEWLLMDMKGNLVNPIFKEVASLIKISNSFKFLQNPLQFLTDLGENISDPK